MLAVDTNLVVRFLTRDGEEQFVRADRLIRDHDVYVPVTVLLEAEWVLRSAYGYLQARVVQALQGFAALSRVMIEDASTTAEALGWAAAGMDFADALHLARTEHCDAFISFDRRLAAVAARVGSPRVRAP